MNKYLIAAGLLGAAVLAGAGAAAQLEGRDPLAAYAPRPTPGWVSLEALVDGVPVPTITHRGKTYLPIPRMGAEYQVRVRNHAPRRIAALVSVDGLSVINGQRASDQAPGYLVDPGRQVVIKGWRRNLDTVAAFRFVSREDSYAWRMGHADQIGTIRLVAFEERVRQPIPLIEKMKSAAPKGPSSRHAALGSTGTAYGRDVDSPAHYVPFVRGARRYDATIYYDTVGALRRAGVTVDRHPPIPRPPEFAPPPPR